MIIAYDINPSAVPNFDKINLSNIYKILIENKRELRQRKDRSFIIPIEDEDVTVYGSYRKEEDPDDDQIVISDIIVGLQPEQEDFK